MKLRFALAGLAALSSLAAAGSASAMRQLPTLRASLWSAARMVASARGPFTDMATAFAAMAMCVEDIAVGD